MKINSNQKQKIFMGTVVYQTLPSFLEIRFTGVKSLHQTLSGDKLEESSIYVSKERSYFVSLYFCNLIGVFAKYLKLNRIHNLRC